ncbi:MAG: polyphosphate polymerase domain-containing protein [Atopobiaceae bacterium]|nr:polyphosphate polymerase domain-containing protein [Atopobiaceae bacterium]
MENRSIIAGASTASASKAPSDGAQQLVFARMETKFLIDADQRARFLELASEHMDPDIHGRSTNCSIYFDTPTRIMARRALEHPDYREKVRMRSYGDSGMGGRVFLEIKKKLRGIVYKRRATMGIERAWSFFDGGAEPATQIEREIAATIANYGGLEPSIYLAYERDAFYAKGDHDVRVTLDDGIRFRTDRLGFGHGSQGESILDAGLWLMEVKTGQAIPMWLVRYLSAERLFKTSYSKYSVAYNRTLTEIGLASKGVREAEPLHGLPTFEPAFAPGILQTANALKHPGIIAARAS